MTFFFHYEPTSPMRVSATRRFFLGGLGALSSSSSTGMTGAVVSSPPAIGPDSGRVSLSGTTLFAGVKGRFDDIRGDKVGGREMVDNAGVVDGVSVDEEVSGTEWLCAMDWN
jgi:hypothetical protein